MQHAFIISHSGLRSCREFVLIHIHDILMYRCILMSIPLLGTNAIGHAFGFLYLYGQWWKHGPRKSNDAQRLEATTRLTSAVSATRPCACSALPEMREPVATEARFRSDRRWRQHLGSKTMLRVRSYLRVFGAGDHRMQLLAGL